MSVPRPNRTPAVSSLFKLRGTGPDAQASAASFGVRAFSRRRISSAEKVSLRIRSSIQEGLDVTINPLDPGQMYGDRVSQLDLRVAKILRFSRATRATVGVDSYNVTNSSVPQTYNGTYGATWLRPTSFMPARFVKLTGQFNF